MSTYTNPVWNRDFPDPFVLRHNGRFYAYGTETAAHGSGFQVMESADLVAWTHRGTCFTPPWSKVQLWAPEVFVQGGTLYCTYSALNPATNKRDIGVATATSPLGPFVHRAIVVPAGENRLGVIDTTVHREPDGSLWLLWSEEDPRGIVLQRLAPDLLSVTGKPTVLMRPDRPWESGVTEAPTVIRRGGRYHLLYSANGFETGKTNSGYCVAHAVAPALAGPYTKTGAMLAQLPGTVFGPGHQSVVALPSGENWLVYHAWDDQKEPRYGSNPIGRTVRIDRLVWDRLPGGGERPRAIGPTTTPQPAPRAR
jgi:beta-xylosidase